MPFAFLVEADAFHLQIGTWQPTSFLGTLPFGIAGVIAFLVALHLSNGMSWLWARLAEGMLGSAAPDAPADRAAHQSQREARPA